MSPDAALRPALAAASVVAAVGGLHVLFAPGSWWLAPVGFAVLAVVVAALARLWRAAAAPVAGAVAVVVAGTAVFAPETAVFGVLPTDATVDRVAELAAAGFESAAVQGVPAVPVPGLVLLLTLLAAGAALVAEALAAHAPAATALPVLTVLAVPVVVESGLADPFWVVLALVAYLALLRRGRRPSPPGWTLAAGAAVVIGALLAPVLLPAPPGTEAAGGAGSRINPLVTLGDDLRRDGIVTALGYSTSDAEGVYLRLAVLDEFDGRQWAPSVPPRGDENLPPDLPGPPGLTSAVARESRSIGVTVAGVSGRWLPLPYPATWVTGLEGDWHWDADGLTLRSTGVDIGGQSYEARFLELRPTVEQLLAAYPDPTLQADHLEVPGEVPATVVAAAQEVAGDAATSWDRALALQNWFRTSGGFVYSEEAPVEGGYDGSGLDVLGEFLDQRSGYCVHFASAMAVMSRLLGIPARVAVGFQPGTPETLDDGTVRWTVTTHDLHAWPELYFEGVGWLRFEPTPGRGALPVYSSADAVDDLVTDPTTGGLDAPPVAPPVVPDADGVDRPDLDVDEEVTPGAPADDPLPAVIGAIVGLVVALLLVPAAIRVGIRMRRVTRMRRGRDAAAAAWAEVRDTARDHGWSAPPGETPRALARRLELVVREPGAVARGRDGVERIAFGRDALPTMSVADLLAVRRGIARASGTAVRVRAVLLPPSLLDRLAASDDAG